MRQRPKKKKATVPKAKPPPTDMIIPQTKPPPPEICKAGQPVSAWDVGGPPGETCEDNVDAGKPVSKPEQAPSQLKTKDQAGTPKSKKKKNLATKSPPAAVVKPAPPVEAKPPPVAVSKPAPPVIPTPSAWETMGPPIIRPPPPPSPLDTLSKPGQVSAASPKGKAPAPVPKLAPVQDEAEVVLPMKRNAQEAKQKAFVIPKLGAKAKSAPKGANPLPQQSAAAAQAPKPAPMMLSGALAAVSSDSRSAASSTKWLERPVERLSDTNAYYEEEDDPELASYLWDRKAQRPKNDQTRIVPKRAAATASQRLPVPSQQRQRALLAQVMEMGFDETSAKRALTATGWNSVEEALAAICGN
mmetsp:Transcript_135195/g.269735  ORF Transcript_135195/g.269735 Transcript_135195/m.269735 type:complete len:357 (+) Transcript_135195:1101-2171(+)